jgi:hypothetical protein
MSKFHKNNEGFWTVCKAKVRTGQGVTGCPIELEGVEVLHTIGLHGIAAAGGGTMRKWIGEDTYRDTEISSEDPDGTFTSSTDKTTRTYTMKGKIVPLADRLREMRHALKARELPTLTASEQWQVDEQYAQLQDDVTNGLRDWNTEAGSAFRERALNASQAMERELHTSQSLSLLLVVAERHNAPEEMKAGLAVVKSHITDEPNAREYIIQKARETKRDAPSVPAEAA